MLQQTRCLRVKWAQEATVTYAFAAARRPSKKNSTADIRSLKMTKNFEPLDPNDTVNQHFVAQAVQSLNAVPSKNGEISHINAYKRVGENTISLANKGGRPIRKNLSLDDLYTFDIEGRLRRNFETLFHRFENDVPEHTLSLIEKVRSKRDDLQDEVQAILRAKFMDFVRNPYNIRDCLRIFPQLATSKPTDPDAAEIHQKVLNGHKPHQDSICKKLSITPQDYRNWLSTMFMLLYPIPGVDEPLLDQILRQMTDEKKNVCGKRDGSAVIDMEAAGSMAI
jgi:hypothetical protein